MLEGYRILDLGQVIAGTIGSMILADMGAEVIKVESPQGDIGRNPAIAGIGPVSSIFLTFNRGKKGIVIDLKKPKAKRCFWILWKNQDAVMVNFPARHDGAARPRVRRDEAEKPRHRIRGFERIWGTRPLAR